MLLLADAKRIITSLIETAKSTHDDEFIPEHMEAWQISIQCMDAQVRIASMYQALEESTNDDAMLTVAIVKEMLTQCFYQLSMEEVMGRLDKLTMKGELNEVNNSDE